MTHSDHQDTSPDHSNADWSIQPAGWRDFTQLNQLEKLCFNHEDAWPFWDLIGTLTFPGYVRLKIEVDERMVGFISGEQQPDKRCGWVTSLAVHPAYRRRGMAQALLQACEAALAQPTIRLSVRASNQVAISLYVSAGYKLVDQWRKYYAGGESALVFEKRR